MPGSKLLPKAVNQDSGVVAMTVFKSEDIYDGSKSPEFSGTSRFYEGTHGLTVRKTQAVAESNSAILQ